MKQQALKSAHRHLFAHQFEQWLHWPRRMQQRCPAAGACLQTTGGRQRRREPGAAAAAAIASCRREERAGSLHPSHLQSLFLQTWQGSTGRPRGRHPAGPATPWTASVGRPAAATSNPKQTAVCSRMLPSVAESWKRPNPSFGWASQPESTFCYLPPAGQACSHVNPSPAQHLPSGLLASIASADLHCLNEN